MFLFFYFWTPREVFDTTITLWTACEVVKGEPVVGFLSPSPPTTGRSRKSTSIIIARKGGNRRTSPARSSVRSLLGKRLQSIVEQGVYRPTTTSSSSLLSSFSVIDQRILIVRSFRRKMTSFFSDDGLDTRTSATRCSNLPRPPPATSSKSFLPDQSQQQQQQQQQQQNNRRMLKCQQRRGNNRFDCLDSTQHSSASSVGTRNNSITGSFENGIGLGGTVALPTILVATTSSSSSLSTRSLLSGMPGLDQTDHSSLTSTSVATVRDNLSEQRIDKDIPKGRENEIIRKRYDDDDDDENSLGSFGGFNDSDDEGGEDSNNVDANGGISDKAEHAIENLTLSSSRTYVKQQKQKQKQPKFHEVQQSFHDSTVSFSTHLTEVIDVVPNLSPTSKKKYFYSDDELSEFRLEYEFELEGLLPSQQSD